MKLIHNNEVSPLLCQMMNAEANMIAAVSEIRLAYNAAGPVLNTALYPLIADAEQLRMKLSNLTEATRLEGK